LAKVEDLEGFYKVGIDFIFVTPDLTLGRAWVVPSRASDHLPVLAEVGP
jgi:endonuclease/exonuclease/phosphatase (EEP) superfamily protein YafD